MARRGESIYKRKDGRWEARYAYGKNEQGKTVYRSVYGKSYSEVKNKRIQALKAADTYKPALEAVPFSQILTAWLDSNRIRIKEQSYQKYRSCIEKHILPEMGRVDIHQITAQHINALLHHKLVCGRLDGKGGLSKSYVRMMSVIITSALNYAASMGMPLQRMGKINRPPLERPSVSVLRQREQQILERYIEKNLSGANLAVYLSLHTGMRLSEICALRWANVDLDAKNLHIVASVVRLNFETHAELQIGSTKTVSSYRVLPLSETLSAILKSEQLRNNSEYVIKPCKKGGFMNPRTLEYQFKKILADCGLPNIPFHALRHTFATRWIENGMDIKSLSEILGHANVSITLGIYVHSSDELKRSGMEKMASISGHYFGMDTHKSLD